MSSQPTRWLLTAKNWQSSSGFLGSWRMRISSPPIHSKRRSPQGVRPVSRFVPPSGAAGSSTRSSASRGSSATPRPSSGSGSWRSSCSTRGSAGASMLIRERQRLSRHSVHAARLRLFDHLRRERHRRARPHHRVPVDPPDVPLQRVVPHMGGHRGRWPRPSAARWCWKQPWCHEAPRQPPRARSKALAAGRQPRR